MEDTEKKAQVRFPFDVWEDMKRLAKEHERSFNGEIVWALRCFIASQKGDTHDATKKL
jgi:Arc-like DNA binding domain